MSVLYEAEWEADPDRRLVVTFDPESEEVYIDQYGRGWDGLSDWPDENGRSMRVSINVHPTGDDEREHAPAASAQQEIPPEPESEPREPALPDGFRLDIYGPDGLVYAWNGGHTVRVLGDEDWEDVFEIHDPAGPPTFDQVVSAVQERATGV